MFLMITRQRCWWECLYLLQILAFSIYIILRLVFDAIVQLHASRVIKAGMLSKYAFNGTSYKVKHDNRWQDLLSSSALEKAEHAPGVGGANFSLSPNMASVPAEADSSPSVSWSGSAENTTTPLTGEVQGRKQTAECTSLQSVDHFLYRCRHSYSLDSFPWD